MRSKKKIADQLKKDSELANSKLVESMNATDDHERNRFLRERNMVMERVYTLKWVLGEYEDL